MTFRPILAVAALAAAFAVTPALAQQRIAVYSAGPADLIDSLAAGFRAATGIHVDVFQGTTGQILARVEAEASNPQVDVMISASWDTALDYAARGWLLAYQSPNAAMVPDFLKTPYAVAQGVSALGIAWNPRSGTPRPTDWSDLALPAYANLVTMPDPAQSGSAFELVAALYGLTDDWSLFTALRNNGMLVAGANAQALNPVLQGARAAVFGAVDYISIGQAAAGESIEVIFPASGTVIAPRPIMIFNWSRNQDAARAFVDYMLSDAGQARVAAVYLMPSRTDIPAARPLIGDLVLLPIDTEAAYASRTQILAGFASATAR